MSLSELSDKIRFYERIFGHGQLTKNQKDFSVCCPICNPKNKLKKKLVIRVKDDVCHCWTCGYRSHSLASLIIRFSSRSELEYYKQHYKRFTKIPQEVEEIKLEIPKNSQLIVNSYQNYKFKNHYNYLKQRNVTEEDMWRYKIFVSSCFEWRNRVIVPSFCSEGKLNFYVGRAIDNNWQRYKNPDCNKDIIFNELLLDWKSPLVICEGVFDCFNCGENTTCLLGSDLNENSQLFTQILLNDSKIILALDHDMLFKKTINIYKKLKNYNISSSIVILPEGKDPGELSKEEFKTLKENAISPDWQELYKLKVKHLSGTRLTL